MVPEGDNFNWYRLISAKGLGQFFLIDNYDQPLGRRVDNLLSQQCGTSALDHVQGPPLDLVRAIKGDV